MGLDLSGLAKTSGAGPLAPSRPPASRETLTLLIGAGLAAALGFVYNVWCSRLIGAAQYADLAAALALVGVLAYTLNPLGLATAQVASRLFASGDVAGIRELYCRMSRRTLVLLVVAGALLVPAAFAAWQFFRFSSMWVPVLAFLVFSILLLLGLARATVRSIHRFSAYSYGAVTEAVLRIAIGIPLVSFFPGAAQALTGYAASAAAVLVVHDRSVRRMPAGPTEGGEIVLPRRMVGAAWALLMAYAVGQNVDLLSLKAFTPAASAGAYAAAWTLARGLTVLTIPLDALLLPRLAVAARPWGALARIARLFLLLWSVPLGAVLVAPAAIVAFLFGPGYDGAASALPWLAVAAMFLSITYLTGQVLLFLHRPHFLVTIALGIAAEIALIVLGNGDLLVTARAVAFAQMATTGANLFWLARALGRHGEEA